MPHWKTMMDRKFIFAFDLNGKDVTLTIERVTPGKLVGEGGRTAKKPIAYFKETKVEDGEKKGLALNATNCTTIEKLYGGDTDGWPGKQITLYPTTTQMGSETKACIRVRPRIPSATKGNGRSASRTEQSTDAPPGEMSDAEKAEIAAGEAEQS